MTRAVLLVILLVLPSLVCAQSVFTTNLVALYAKVPPPPADVQEAYARCTVTQGISIQNSVAPISASADAFYAPHKQRMEAFSAQLEARLHELARPMEQAAQQVDQKEVQKKMKSMSRDEQIKYAMEMSKKMGLTPKPMVQEPPAVQAALNEHMRLLEETGKEFQSAGAVYQEEQAFRQSYEKQHAEVQAWEQEELKKLPQVSYGEMGGPEPKAEYALKLKVSDKHIAVENAYLKEVGKRWKTKLAKYTSQLSAFQEKMLAVRCGEDARNDQNKQILITSTQNLLKPMTELIALSQEPVSRAAGYLAAKQEIQKNKPQ